MKRADTNTTAEDSAGYTALPATYSTIDADALLNFTLDNWDVKKGSKITFLKRGMNDTYCITEPSGKKFILRVYSLKMRTPRGILEEVLFNDKAARGKHFGLASCIFSKFRFPIEGIEAPEGDRLAVLYNFAPGIMVRKLTNTQAKRLGKETAKMHELMKTNSYTFTDFNYDIGLQFKDTLAVLKPILAEHKEQYEYLNKLKKDFVKTFKEVKKEDLSLGLCHGDLQPENIHFTDDNKVIFFDFDLMGKGYQAYDIGVFMWYDHKNKTPEIIKSFLEGYESIRKLSAAEHRLLPYFSTLRAMFQMTLYCKTNNGKHLPLWKPEEVASFVNKIKQWHESKRKA